MRPDWLQQILDTPGMYTLVHRPGGGGPVILSKGGKLYGVMQGASGELLADNVLGEDGFAEGVTAEGPMTCLWCEEPIAEGDLPSPATVNATIIHWECGLRSIAGGVNHQKGLCSCYGGDAPNDPPGMSRREAAKAAAEEWQKRQN